MSRTDTCADYIGVASELAKSGEVCKHFHILSHYCKLHTCECIFNLQRKAPAMVNEWEFVKDFGLVLEKG